MPRLRNPLGATPTTEAERDKRGDKGIKIKYQRTSSFVFCQLYEHQLFISVVGQTGREIKGPAIISSSGDSVRDSCIRDVPVEHGCTPAVHGRLHQQTYHILKHKM